MSNRCTATAPRTAIVEATSVETADIANADDPPREDREPLTDAPPPGPGRWYRRLRAIGFIALGVVTLLGVRSAVGDWDEVSGYWSGQLLLLPAVFSFAALDIVLQGVAWVWVFERFGIRTRDRMGALVFLTGYAGVLLPAQLGRLIRPDTLVGLGRGRLSHCCKAEGAVFVLDAVSVVALLAGLLAWRVHPALAPVGAAGVIVTALYLGNRIGERLAGTRLGLPDRFWWDWRSAAVVVIEMLGWAAHGIGFFILVSGLSESIRVWDALFFTPASAVAGVASGLPGGVVATEGFLGAYLRFNEVGTSNLAVAVGAFRAVTFWVWIPIGWTALLIARRGSGSNAGSPRRMAQRIGEVAHAEGVASGGREAHVDGC